MMRCVALLGLLFIACGGEESSTASPTPTGPLVNAFDWQLAAASEDPFASLQPETVSCSPESYGPEDLAGIWVYSIDTRDCNWLTVKQKTTVGVAVGDTIRANVWHFELNAPEPAHALVGLASAEAIMDQVEEPIPQTGRLVQLNFLAQTPMPADSWLYFHLNNHGANSWHLVEIVVNPEVTP
jgi:hypothetical protein